MKIAILGGGFTGLSAAFDLSRKGHDVTVYEQGAVLGGLAAGFREPGWDWYLERAYHHLFANDSDILGLAADCAFPDIFFTSPETSSLYRIGDNYRTFPLDTPQDLLRFPLLSVPERVRTGLVLGYLKYMPFTSLYERQSAYDFLTRYMGNHAYEVMFGELFRKKFGKYAEKILTAFIWARITKRTKQLGYVKGGFQTFITHLDGVTRKAGVDTRLRHGVEQMRKKGDGFELKIRDLSAQKTYTAQADRIISTLPTPVLAKVGGELFPAYYTQNLRKIEYLHAICVILESQKRILDKTYWLNICIPELPTMLVAQHTNLVGAEHYGNNHIAYTANYVSGDHPLVKMEEGKVVSHYVEQLKQINPQFDGSHIKSFVFRAPFAQPIFDRGFLKYKPDYETPVKNFIVANLDMTYPYDRGTNYAVKLGRNAAGMI